MNQTVPIPSFIGGVSQQPDSIRFSNQFPEVINYYLNPLTGAERRPGSRFVGELAAFTNEAVGHLIDRGDSEHYLVVAKSSYLHVYNADTAQEYAVVAPGTVTPATLTYLAYTASGEFARKHLRFLTIGDFTFVLNRQKQVAVTSATTPVDSGSTTGQAFIWIRKGNYNRSYDFILRDGTNNAILASAQTGSGLVSSTGASDTELDFRNADLLFAITAVGAVGSTWTLDYTIGGVAAQHTYVVVTGDTVETVAKKIVGKINGGSTTAGTDRQAAVAFHLSDGRFMLRGGKRKYAFSAVTLANGGGGTVTAAAGTLQTAHDERTLQSVDTAVIAARIAGVINKLSSTIVAEVFGSVIRLTSANAFTRIETSFDAAQTEVVVFNRAIDTFTNLPDTCYHGYVVEVRRNVESQANQDTAVETSYYTKFTADSGSGFGRGRWNESLAPGSHYALDATTLPHQLVRKFGGTQTETATLASETFSVDTPFYSASDLTVKKNGVVTASWTIATSTSITVTGMTPGDTIEIINTAIYFEFGAATWTDKQVGSDVLVPNPSMVGKTLNDMAFFKNRLVLLCESNVLMSETFRYYNFWRTTMLAVVDTDTIDVQAAYSQVVDIESALPFGERLMLFDDNVQFTLSGSPLTPSSVSIVPSGHFDLSLESRPLFAGMSMLAPFERETFGGVRELLFSQDIDIMDGEDVTIQCPRYIKGRLLDFCGSAIDGLYFARGDFEDNSTFYVYKTVRYGRERQQSAWSKWAMDENLVVRFLGVAGPYLYIVANARSNNTPFLVKLSLDPFAQDVRRTDTPPGVAVGLSPYMLHLDCIVPSSSTTPVYDEDTNTTEITLPWDLGNIELDKIWVIQAKASEDAEFGRRYTVISRNDHVLVVKGEATDYDVGIEYESYIELGKPSLRTQRSSQESPTERLTSSTTVVGGKVRLVDSGFLEIAVSSPYRTIGSTFITGKEVGNPTFQIGRANLLSGEYQFWVNLPRGETTVVFRSSSPLPLAIAGAEWQIRLDSTFISGTG